ncbi:SNF2-related protein [Roseateles sp.]|uniref:SNF2-related protein n=1 Tax=Roseateles sp. TaxID=1971397 RepID=UPI003BA4F35A
MATSQKKPRKSAQAPFAVAEAAAAAPEAAAVKPVKASPAKSAEAKPSKTVKKKATPSAEAISPADPADKKVAVQTKGKATAAETAPVKKATAKKAPAKKATTKKASETQAAVSLEQPTESGAVSKADVLGIKKPSSASKKTPSKVAETRAAVRDILNGVQSDAEPQRGPEVAAAEKTPAPKRGKAAGKPVATGVVAESQPDEAPAAVASALTGSASRSASAKKPKREEASAARRSSPSPQRAQAPAVNEARVTAKPKPPARFSAEALGDANSSVFGDYQVRALQGEGSWRVNVRGSNPAECRCTCDEFLFGALGRCEHVEFVLGSLLDDAEQRGRLEQGDATEYSEIRLGHGARRYLRWRQGRSCPAALSEAARGMLDDRGRLRADADDDVQTLLALAAEAGHELRVEPGVWALLALGRDARRRIQVLEQACPQGLESASLRSLLRIPLPLYQLEAAIFAACAGRSLLACDLGLGLYAPAYAAAALLSSHFGLERVLILCAESAQSRWLTEAQTLSPAPAQMIWGDASARRAQCVPNPEGGPEIRIASSASLGQDLALLQTYAPELIIVDEAQRLDAQALSHLRQLDQGLMLMLSSQVLDEQPQTLMPLVDLLDRHRTGPWDQFLSRHVRRDAQGGVAGFVALEALDQSLERLMFSQSRADLQSTLPAALVQLRGVPLTELQQELQAPLLAQLRQAVARWQRSAYVSDAEQLKLRELLQSLRRLAIAPQLLGEAVAGSEATEAPKVLAAAAVCREMLGASVDHLVVFCQWDDALQLLAERLRLQGLPVLHLQPEGRLVDQQAKVSDWLQKPQPSVLLCSDLASLGLRLSGERVGLINLELPWSEALLEQRLQSLIDDHSRGLPLIQMLAQTGLESALLQTMDAHTDVPAAGLDGGSRMHLLQGEDLQRFMQAVSTVEQLLRP